jgi:hypothetical protein
VSATTAGNVGLEDVLIVPSDGTRVIAVQRTDVQPGSERAVRLAIADNRAQELSDFDPAVVAALANEVDLADFWRDDELEDLLASVGNAAPSLDDLEARYGEPGEDAFWATITLKVPPGVNARYRSLMDAQDGETDAERFANLLALIE